MQKFIFKAMDDIGVVIHVTLFWDVVTLFWDVVTVILVVNNYVITLTEL